MAGGKGKSAGGKSSGGKTSAADGPKKQQSHSARAGLQVSSCGYIMWDDCDIMRCGSRRAYTQCLGFVSFYSTNNNNNNNATLSSEHDSNMFCIYLPTNISPLSSLADVSSVS